MLTRTKQRRSPTATFSSTASTSPARSPTLSTWSPSRSPTASSPSCATSRPTSPPPSPPSPSTPWPPPSTSPPCASRVCPRVHPRSPSSPSTICRLCSRARRRKRLVGTCCPRSSRSTTGATRLSGPGRTSCSRRRWRVCRLVRWSSKRAPRTDVVGRAMYDSFGKMRR
ncbi:hypothetical protein VTJ49DRAFT_4110 [Mycothermus thermophilus]|uniref:Uncharacterized protein n=1 Tax=Humicola insolens TaxID=85995 RepID=A0ABR3V821_HUMIN